MKRHARALHKSKSKRMARRQETRHWARQGEVYVPLRNIDRHFKKHRQRLILLKENNHASD